MALLDTVTHSDGPIDRRVKARQVTLGLLVLLVCTCIFSLAIGPTGTSLWSAFIKIILDQELTTMEQVVLWDIRFPRMIMGCVVGASLAVSGALMQGLFRNPLADPGLVGVGAGAGLGAILAIVLGGLLPVIIIDTLGNYFISFAAFIGGWGSTIVLYRVSTRGGRTSVSTMLLAGIALGALAGAASGVLVYLANDQQLRDLTFWGLGSLAGATWAKVFASVPIMLFALIFSAYLGRGLNGLALGEATAAHLGVDVQRLKNRVILSVAAATGAAVAVSGGIGFIGIVVPHLLRISTGPDHETLLINAALLGASLLIAADIVSRMVVAPAELPIGIVTAIIGAPVFLWILMGRRGIAGL